MHPSFRKLKLLHQFYNEFGPQLAPMVAFLPEQTPKGAADAGTLRCAVRTDGDGGFLFVNNYVHNLSDAGAQGSCLSNPLAKFNGSVAPQTNGCSRRHILHLAVQSANELNPSGLQHRGTTDKTRLRELQRLRLLRDPRRGARIRLRRKNRRKDHCRRRNRSPRRTAFCT